MKTIEEKNRMIAEFMRLRKSFTIDEYRHPVTRKRIKSRDTKIECFTMPEESDIVKSIYTDRPGFEWQNEFNHDDIKEGSQELVFLIGDLKYHAYWDWLMPVLAYASSGKNKRHKKPF